MPYVVAIRKNSTGEVREYIYDGAWEDHHLFMWTEGNYSCDCNRADFFASVVGEEIEDQPCGEAEYAALHARLAGGEIIPLDDPS